MSWIASDFSTEYNFKIQWIEISIKILEKWTTDSLNLTDDWQILTEKF